MADIDLCSVADVRAVLQKQPGDSQQDQILAWLITIASKEVMRHAGREFAPATADATRTFVWSDGWLIDLAPYDLRAVVAITLDVDEPVGDQTVLQARDYRLRPKPSVDGVYTRVELNSRSITDWRYANSGDWCEREVSIRGAWGFADVPDEAKHAAAITVADWFREKVAAFGTTFNDVTERFEVPENLPAGAMAAVRPLTRQLAL